MGLTNIQIMIPFVRTVSEAKRVIELLAQNGLKPKQSRKLSDT
jgi:pyruvate,water dikinase